MNTPTKEKIQNAQTTTYREYSGYGNRYYRQCSHYAQPNAQARGHLKDGTGRFTRRAGAR